MEHQTQNNETPAINHELIEQLAQSIARITVHQVPLKDVIWTAEECAAYLKMSLQRFQASFAPHPKFPRPIRLEGSACRSHPKWYAIEVIEWVRKQRK